MKVPAARRPSPKFFAMHVGSYRPNSSWQLTERPAVLALWAARPEIATPEVAADFSASLAYGLAHLAEICAEAARELQLPAKELSLYLRTNIDYSLDAENLKGLTEYFTQAARLGLIPKLNALAIL